VKEVQRPELLTIAADAPKPEPDPEPKIDPAKTTTITCAGGLFFDVEKSHVVYLKDVVVKKPDFTLTAGKELKVFLAKKAVKEGEEKPDGIGAFDDIETIVATGGIKVTRKDDKGQLLTATADTATYDAKSGDIVLRGGFPRVQQGPNFVRALEPGLYVRIYANGKGFFEEGKWETSLVNPDKGKKPN
jgi:lipopolysaccharide export system protein LptA